MPTFTITVVDPPSSCLGYASVELLLQTTNGHERPASKDEGTIVFNVPFELKADRAGHLQPSGAAIQRGNDGRRFVYLSWLGVQGNTAQMFRRLKVYFDSIPGYPDQTTEYSVKVKGRDKVGNPACATATTLP